MIKMQKSITRKNLKYIILILGRVFSSHESSYAKFDGFYVGGSLGYLQQNTSIDAAQNPNNPNAHINRTNSQQGHPTPEIFIGWGKNFTEYFYGGVEGRIDWVVGKDKFAAEDTNFIYITKRKGTALSALFRFGYLLELNTMIYGGFGIKIVKFECDMYEKTGGISSPSINKTPQALYELGIETKSEAIKNLAYRLSYSFTVKKNKSQRPENFHTNHVYRDSGIFKVGSAEHAVRIGLQYQF